MGKRPVTSSERKGILAVAAIALIVTGIGLAASFADNHGDSDPAVTMQVIHQNILTTDSANSVNTDSLSTPNSNKKTKSSGRKKDSSSSGNQPKTYPRRSPLDEHVPEK